MLQIIKKDGVKGYEKLLDDLGIINDPDIKISEAVDGDKVNGFGIYKITPEKIYIYSLSAGEDIMLADGILRSVLFLAALRGVERAEFLNNTEEYSKKLGMIKEGFVLEPISDIFGGCENCKANN